MISFIVPAHNEAALLPATLAALHRAAPHCGMAHEIIVVDDASTDATPQVAIQGGARVVCVNCRHIAATRNAGAQAAKGNVLVFVDADTHVSPELLAAAMVEIHKGAAGGGATVEMVGTMKRHERMAVSMLAWAFRHFGVAPGCFVFCTRAAFDSVHGFDENLNTSEDVAIGKSLARVGRFAILRQVARTSDRQLRGQGLSNHLRLFVRFAMGDPKLVQDRGGLGVRAGGRRDT